MTSRPRVYDTRYFWAIFTETNPDTVNKLRELYSLPRERFVSSPSLYEVYKLSITKEGRDTAELRCAAIKKEMRVVDVSAEIAEEAARISHQSEKPMADALIIATAKLLHAECVTDDPHFKEVRIRWI